MLGNTITLNVIHIECKWKLTPEGIKGVTNATQVNLEGVGKDLAMVALADMGLYRLHTPKHQAPCCQM